MPRRHNNTGRSRKNADFVMLDRSLLRSPAYRSLTTQERAVLVELFNRYNGRNNGRIGLSVRVAAEECNIAKNTACRAFRELVNKGFVECVTPGGFSRKTRHATEWRLTHHRCDVTEVLPTRGYLKWGRKNKTRSQNETATVPECDHSPPTPPSSGNGLVPLGQIPAVARYLEKGHI